MADEAQAAAMEPASGRARLNRVFATVFLRDWHPLLRDPLDLVRLSFGVGASSSRCRATGTRSCGCSSRGRWCSSIRALDVPRPIDWLFCAAMVFQGWGNALHLFSDYWWYDNTVHITLPASLAPILYIGFSRLDVVPDPAQRVGSTAELVGMALIAACLGVTAASGYEIYEWVVDHWFGQHLFIGETDTVTDLADGFLGAAIGGALLALWAVARYTSQRLPSRLARDLLSPPSTERGPRPAT